ncbi:hypothetical protein [Sphingobium chungbukense]|uniref:hypothetical protein n=1 Tax=Sphingobium chungbukense TaxID=56193 RepID=UPI0018DD89C7|nr:hypothetical protein [Sphingobium chungbukense]
MLNAPDSQFHQPLLDEAGISRWDAISTSIFASILFHLDNVAATWNVIVQSGNFIAYRGLGGRIAKEFRTETLRSLKQPIISHKWKNGAACWTERQPEARRDI